jgi:uncharacterized protein (DUF2132 family)
LAAVEGAVSHLEAGDIASLIGFLRKTQQAASQVEAVRNRVQQSPSAQLGNVPLSQLGRSLDVRI